MTTPARSLPISSGRSILLRQLANNAQSRIACFSVKGSPRFDTAHLFGSVLEAFKTPVPSDLKDALDALVPSLQGTFERYNRLSTIVLDDADQVPVDELTKLLSSVLYLNGQEEPLLRVLLSSNPEFEERLPDALPEGAEIRYASLIIDPMDTNRAESYLEFRLNQAGYFDNFPFTDRDMQSIMEESGGFPRALNGAAALNVNAQHGQLPESMLPPLACLMILAGLFMFTKNEGERSPASQASDGYRTVETVALNTDEAAQSTELEIVDDTSESDTQTSSEQNSATASANNSAPDNASAETNAEEQANTAADEVADAADAEPEAAPEPAADAAPESADANDESEQTAEVAAESAPEEDASVDSDAANNSDEALLADTTDTQNSPEQDSTDAADENQSTARAGVLESPNWILVQDPARFTVQMSASTDRDSVESFMTRNNLPAPNSIFSFNRNGDTWYALVHGLFTNVPEAREALRKLPEGALRNQPWIRRIGQVQSSLKEQN